MCGILLGIIHDNADRGLLRLARRDIDRAMSALDARGGDSWGLTSSGGASYQLRLSGLGMYSAGGTVPLLVPGSVVVGHTRFATRGAVHIGNAHPFQHLGYSVAHNGGYFADIPDDTWADCDSHALTGYIARAINTGRDVVLPSGGYGTVAAGDGDGLGYVWRSGGQCHAVRRPWGMLVTSVPVDGLTGAAVSVPDDETVRVYDSHGACADVARVTLRPAPRWTASPARGKGRSSRGGAVERGWSTCLACRSASLDCEGGVCRDCLSAWEHV